ncbi:hypothetical protein SEUBUCD646_0M00990 [Saccharomyces eubayanus]|uniref:Uncharacterized protein n=1 Tax=Saccharomyces eubayanus TaxID=1080349 RepID=A0ABN8VHY8_SACEU|nr:hypothetical protein SEUBUCD650_0M00980 [Saccharomyces eubayanus]CAI1648455.1 hypothetical protein SEUBUCD646_0M00990 [Saccharomyces eubayanus]
MLSCGLCTRTKDLVALRDHQTSYDHVRYDRMRCEFQQPVLYCLGNGQHGCFTLGTFNILRFGVGVEPYC